jgi:predicted transcriptional regulator
MTNNQSSVRDGIETALDENGGEVQGTARLANHLNTDEHWLRKCARVLERAGLITITPSRGGRGNRTIYKRNRNSPGQPRRKHQ